MNSSLREATQVGSIYLLLLIQFIITILLFSLPPLLLLLILFLLLFFLLFIFLQTYSQAASCHHFYSDSALLELYRYAHRYGEEINEGLTEDKLVLVAAQFNSLRQKFTVN